MIVTGIFQFIKNGEVHRTKSKFESTGCRDKYENNKVIWRRLTKEGKPTNMFAIQSIPNVPWATGKWFSKIDGGWVLENFPEIKVETTISKSMTDAEYISYLHRTYESQ